MIASKEIFSLPQTLAEFIDWESNDGFKYEWNDGELIKFTGMNKTQAYIFATLSKLFSKNGLNAVGTLISEYDVWLSGIQMRRPDIAFLTNEQLNLGRNNEEVIPEFVIEIISGNDKLNPVQEKVTEYFKAGVKVVWLILPEEKLIEIYTSRRNVQICIEDDVCSAAPVLPYFEIKVSELFA
jgi:Uma2 family endonuclease